MSDAGKRKSHGLGRGLSALLGEDRPAAAVPPGAASEAASGSGRAPQRMPIAWLEPNRFQPRHLFDEQAIADLVASIRRHGILQPLLVRPVADADGERFEIVAGERRWRAAQAAGLHDVPVVVRALDDGQVLEAALIENIQREDLSPIEEARGYRRLIGDFGHTQKDLATAVGKSRSHIANMVRLLTLPEAVQEMLDDGRLSIGHARALITTDDPVGLARVIVSQGLNVRQAERLAAQGEPKDGRRRRPAKDADTRALEANLSGALGLKVVVRHRRNGGELLIAYRTLDQLDEICRRLCQSPDDI